MKAVVRLLLVLALAVPAFAPLNAQTRTESSAAAQAPTCRLFASNTIVGYNTKVRLDWQSTGAASGYLTAVGAIGANGSATVVPGKNTTYAASFSGPGGTIVCRVAVAVLPTGPGTGYSGGVTNINGTVDVKGSSIDTNNPVDTNSSIDTNNPVNTGSKVNTSGTVDLGGNVTLPTAASIVPQTPSGNGFTGGIVPAECRGKSTIANCDICSLAQLGQNLANFLLGLTIPAAALMFAWAGILYFSSRANPVQIERAHKIFKTVVIAFVLAVSAWVLVNTVMNALIQGGDIKSYDWRSLRCTETRQARLYNMSLEEYLKTSLPSTQSYSGSFVSNTGGCPAGSSPEGGRCYDTTGGNRIDVGAASSGGGSAGTLFDEGKSCPSTATYSEASGGCVDKETGECALEGCGVLKYDANPSSGPGGSCPAGYKYTQDDKESWCENINNPDIWTDTDGSGGVVSQVATGDCSPAEMQADWGNNAAAMSCIVTKESSCNTSLASKSDKGADGQPFSFGLYQINVNANYMQCEGFNSGKKVDCPSAFAGKNFTGVVVNQDLYNQCKAMANNEDCAQENAERILDNQGFKAWSTAKACGL